MTSTILEIGAIVRPAMTDKILYRVVSVRATGCSVEAVGAEVVDVPGRRARPIHYSEKRFSLAFSRNGGMFDDRWRAWTVVNAS